MGPTLYVFGGCTAAGRAADLYAFDTETRTWAQGPLAEVQPKEIPPCSALRRVNVVPKLLKMKMLGFRSFL